MARVLIVEDEVLINKHITDELTYIGHKCSSAFDGEEALDLINSNTFDLIILDVMLPKISGFELMKHIKKVPVIFVTAKSDLNDRLNGLELGADDYIVKPFSMMEMVSRVKAVLRRSQPQQVSKLLKVGGLVVNLDEHTVVVDGNRVQLTYKEFELLRMFLSHPGMVYTREQLFSQVWKLDYMGDSRTLDSHIRTLRQKLDGYGKMIETVRNVGYRWEAGYDK